jgi:uncharacterized protein (UPF0303 family)
MSQSHPISSLGLVTSFETANPAMIPLIIDQENLSRFTTFNWDTAWQLGTTIRDLFLERYAEKVGNGSGIVIMIEVWGGHEDHKAKQ